MQLRRSDVLGRESITKFQFTKLHRNWVSHFPVRKVNKWILTRIQERAVFIVSDVFDVKYAKS